MDPHVDTIRGGDKIHFGAVSKFQCLESVKMSNTGPSERPMTN